MASLEPPEPGKKLEIKISHETNLGTYLGAGYDAQKEIDNLYQALQMARKELARFIEHHDEYGTGRSTGVLFHLPKDQQRVGRAAGMAFITAAAIQATRNVIEALVLPEAASLLDKPGHRSQTACDKLPRIWWIPIGAKPVSTMIDQCLHLSPVPDRHRYLMACVSDAEKVAVAQAFSSHMASAEMAHEAVAWSLDNITTRDPLEGASETANKQRLYNWAAHI